MLISCCSTPGNAFPDDLLNNQLNKIRFPSLTCLIRNCIRQLFHPHYRIQLYAAQHYSHSQTLKKYNYRSKKMNLTVEGEISSVVIELSMSIIIVAGRGLGMSRVLSYTAEESIFAEDNESFFYEFSITFRKLTSCSRDDVYYQLGGLILHGIVTIHILNEIVISSRLQLKLIFKFTNSN